MSLELLKSLLKGIHHGLVETGEPQTGLSSKVSGQISSQGMGKLGFSVWTCEATLPLNEYILDLKFKNKGAAARKSPNPEQTGSQFETRDAREITRSFSVCPRVT